jgi:predicted HAD superfamily Cof-like phosphohydrolase
MSLDECWSMVREFQERFGHPVGKMPDLLSRSRSEARYRWMLEELDEFLQAETLYEQSDAMIDLIYFALGTLVEMGVKPSKLFEIVHDANMRKLWPDSRPRFDGSGKTIKPHDWRGPEEDLQFAIDRQRGIERDGHEEGASL